MTVNPIVDPTARWLAEMDRAYADPSGQRIWDIYKSPPFAHLWYEARNQGERMRASAVAWLYAHQAQPGGPYPDPREPATFSELSILNVAAHQLGLTIHQRTHTTHTTQPTASSGSASSTGFTGATGFTGFTEDAASMAPEDGRTSTDPWLDGAPTAGWIAGEPWVWLATYPAQSRRPPSIEVAVTSPAVPPRRINFEVACMLGYISKDHARLLGPDAPTGISLMPNSPSALAIMHQFTIALLCLQLECPEEWPCQCNAIRSRFNAPPPSHDQPTETLTLAELADEQERQRKPS